MLALDEQSHRSLKGLEQELQMIPRSSNSWESVAQKHPEFFRVKTGASHGVSLIARHVSGDLGSLRPILGIDLLNTLMSTAIDMHDRQVKRSERWTYLVPIWAASSSQAL